MKKGITLIILLLFSCSTLLMPYANFEDAHSLMNVYHNFLSEDPDMDFGEFLSEKLFVQMPEEEEEDELPIETKIPTTPINVQIQQGVIIATTLQEIALEVSDMPDHIFILNNHRFFTQSAPEAIFHPPLLS